MKYLVISECFSYIGFQELNLEAKFYSEMKYTYKFSPLLFLLCWASYSIVHTRNDPIENCSKITSMQYSKQGIYDLGAETVSAKQFWRTSKPMATADFWDGPHHFFPHSYRSSS